MPRPQLFVALLLLPACDAALTAQAEPASQPVAVAAVDEAAVELNAGAAVEASASANAEIEISADAFKLGEVTTLVQAGTIETAEELELAINDPEANINTIDIDVDGKIDHIEVVEVRNDARVDFEFKVIPSSKATVTHAVNLATASVVANSAASEVSFSASFSTSVHFSAGATARAEVYSFVAPARFEASAVVVGMPLLAWAFVPQRPVYHSIYIEPGSGRWIPPGHLKHGHWKATGGVNPGAGGGHGKGHGDFDGRVDVHGGGKAGGKAHGSLGGDDHGKGGNKGSSGPAPKQASKGASHNDNKPQPSKSSSSGSKGGGGGGGSKGGGGGSSKGGGGGGGKGGKGK